MPGMRLVLALFLALSGATAHAQTPNFSGFWTLDREASDITPPAFSGGRGGASSDALQGLHPPAAIAGPEDKRAPRGPHQPGDRRRPCQSDLEKFMTRRHRRLPKCYSDRS